MDAMEGHWNEEGGEKERESGCPERERVVFVPPTIEFGLVKLTGGRI